MEMRIIASYVAILVVLWLLVRFPRSIATRIAFSWIGPVPREDETWARYQLRWAVYALDWLGQIAFLFASLHGAAHFFPEVQEHQAFLALAAFALPIGASMALLGTVACLLKAAKARYMGPNPVFRAQRGETVPDP